MKTLGITEIYLIKSIIQRNLYVSSERNGYEKK